MKRVLLATPLVVLLVVQLFPVAIVIFTSLKSEVALLEHGLFSWAGLGTGNFQRVLTDKGFIRSLVNSCVIALGSTLASVMCGSLAAYALSRFQFRGRTVLATGLLCGRLLPPVALAVPLFLLLDKVQLTDTRAGLVLAHTSFNLPFAIWLLIPFFEGLPRQLEEAARMDGCSTVQTFWYVLLPLVLPGLLVTSVFCFLLSWNDFLFSLLLGGSRVKTAPLAVNAYMTGFSTEWGPMTASSIVILVPVFVFSLLLQRHLVGGMAVGGLKG